MNSLLIRERLKEAADSLAARQGRKAADSCLWQRREENHE